MSKILPIGKLDSDILQKIVLDNISYKRDEVLTRAGIGEDCARIDFGNMDCIISTDPITASVKDVGRLAIYISCNDIATDGIQPVGILLTVMLPVGTSEDDIAYIMKQAASAAKNCEVEIIGGHTEITASVSQPVIVSTAIGRTPKEKNQSATQMKPGDFIYVTKTLGLEGSGIIASEKGEELREEGHFTKEELAHAEDMLNSVSVIKEGLLAGELGTSGMHDITEGGVLGAMWELCQIADLGANLIEEAMPLDEVTAKICKHYEIDPLRLISSGSMLIIVDPSKAQTLEANMHKAGIMLTKIGEIKEKEYGIMMTLKEGGQTLVDPPAADELYKVY